jgi:hypothetical protein
MRGNAIDQSDGQPDDGLPLVLDGSDLQQVIDAPFDRQQENPAGGNTRRSEVLLKVRRMSVGWILLISSFYFTFISSELESDGRVNNYLFVLARKTLFCRILLCRRRLTQFHTARSFSTLCSRMLEEIGI